MTRAMHAVRPDRYYPPKGTPAPTFGNIRVTWHALQRANYLGIGGDEIRAALDEGERLESLIYTGSHYRIHGRVALVVAPFDGDQGVSSVVTLLWSDSGFEADWTFSHLDDPMRRDLTREWDRYKPEVYA